jgi:hypothetical protein
MPPPYRTASIHARQQLDAADRNAGRDWLSTLGHAHQITAYAEGMIQFAAEGARDAGATWEQIGTLLGMTKQGAQQRFGRDTEAG